MPADAAGRDAAVRAMCDAVDAGDPEAFGAWFADDAAYRFNAGAPVHGRAGVIDATRGAIGSMPWVRHRVDQVAHVGDQLFCRFTISTAAADAAEVALPCVTVIWLADGEIVDYRVHLDLSPLG
jgi:hypothetical protein